MTVREALIRGGDTLRKHTIPTPHLDACLLLGCAMGMSKERLLASYPDDVGTEELKTYQDLLDRRISGIPVSYLRGIKEFYGRDFLVDSRVLVPRPDTEILVDTVLDLANTQPGIRRVHDTCTGTGCIALTLKLERPDLDISASDISPAACEVFLENRRSLGSSVPIYESDLLLSAPGTFDIITANPPYITDHEYELMADANWPEPRNALAAGDMGLDIIERLIKESVEYLAPKGYLVYEAAPPQFHDAKALMSDAGFTGIEIRKDLAGRDRVLLGRI